MNVGIIEDRSNSNCPFYGYTRPFDNPTAWSRKESRVNNLFTTKPGRAPELDLSSGTIQANPWYTKGCEIPTIPTPPEDKSHHRHRVVKRALLSYFCWSSNKDSEAVSTLAACLVKRRVPLVTLAPRGVLSSSSIWQDAVLPKRRIIIHMSERPLKRFRPSDHNHEAVNLQAQHTTLDKGEREKAGQNCFHPKGCDAYNCGGINDTEDTSDLIDSNKIFRQLNILKRGGYWKHLVMGGSVPEHVCYDDGDVYEEEQNRIRKEENKENLPRAGHPNIQITNSSQGEWSYEEDDFIQEEEEFHSNGVGPFVGSALVTNSKHGMVDGPVGFRVHEITEDGWMCSHCHGAIGPSNTSQHPLLLFHLPDRVATLGRMGMVISGIDLMKRRDNGALEPHTHDLRRSPSTMPTDYLFGTISIHI